MAGKITDAKVGLIAPGAEAGEMKSLRLAALFFEVNIPRSGYGREVGFGPLHIRTGGLPGAVSKDDEGGPPGLKRERHGGAPVARRKADGFDRAGVRTEEFGSLATDAEAGL